MRKVLVGTAVAGVGAACGPAAEAPDCNEIYKVVISASTSTCEPNVDGLEQETYWYCLEKDGSKVQIHYAERDGDREAADEDWHFFAPGTLEGGVYLVYDTGVVEDRTDPDRGSILYRVEGVANLDGQNLVWDGTETITVYPDDTNWPEGCSHVSDVWSEVSAGE